VQLQGNRREPVTMAMGVGETITVINKSGKVVSSVRAPHPTRYERR
jgi:hypothetical protein